MVFIVIDDDPTGSQAVSNVPVLFSTELKDFEWALGAGDPGVFVLTNSRALPEAEAVARTKQAVRVALDWSGKTGRPVDFISRSDSCLRGHFRAEIDAILEETELEYDAVIVVPAFPDAGRVTKGGVHYAGEVPIGESDYAKDPAFGFAESDMGEWIAARYGRKVAHRHVDKQALRGEGVKEILLAAQDAVFITADIESNEDIDLFAQAVKWAQQQYGKRFIFRTGPTFAAALLGKRDSQPVDPCRLIGMGTSQVGSPEARGTLVVVGSHVPRSNSQVQYALLHTPGAEAIEVSVPEIADGSFGPAECERVAARVIEHLRADGTVFLMTSRMLVPSENPLALAAAVSDVMVQIVKLVTEAVEPRYIISKGGITSDQIARKALGIKRGRVVGPVLPGIVSVLEYLRPGGKGQLIIFPGNVGEDDALVHVMRRMRGPLVGVIGLGAMGLPMAQAAAEKFPVRGLEADESRHPAILAAGIQPVGREEILECTHLVVVVRSPEQLRALISDLLPDLNSLHTLIVCATVGPDVMEEVAALLAPTGAGLIDAPISGGAVRARRGDLLITASATDKDYAAAAPVLRQFALKLVRVGDRVGQGQAMKTVNQLLCGVHIAAAAEALALATRMGLEPRLCLDALQAGAAESFMLGDRGGRMLDILEEDGHPGVRSRMDIFLKDMGIVTRAAADHDLAAPLAEVALRLYQRGVDAGMGARDDSEVLRLLLDSEGHTP
ncbi:MAG: four-carbon acid sugar kinase family protein [Corynebacterium sp.]|nr:four-carbon acid sugar kinase family protein [Corynebacterium sp.]